MKSCKELYFKPQNITIVEFWPSHSMGIAVFGKFHANICVSDNRGSIVFCKNAGILKHLL